MRWSITEGQPTAANREHFGLPRDMRTLLVIGQSSYRSSMKPMTTRTRFEIVGWEVVAIGALWSVLQLLAFFVSESRSIIERFTIDGGSGVIGLALVLIGMEALSLTHRIGPASPAQPSSGGD
jgi:hypothetical protein